jgi:hypothetical protein
LAVTHWVFLSAWHESAKDARFSGFWCKSHAKPAGFIWEMWAYYASPLAADGRIYFFDAAGTTTVIKPGIRFEVLAINKLDEKTMASPAVVDKAIYLRTSSRLYRLENTVVPKK